MSATVYSFGEWLPDQAAFGNAGLVEANNVLADIGGYRPYYPLAVGGATLPATAKGAYSAIDLNSNLQRYAATAELLFLNGVTRTAASLSASTSDWQFVQFKNLVFAVNGNLTMFHTVGAATNFATSAAPRAGVVGTVGEFVVVGDFIDSTTRPNSIRWCAIGDGTSWPTPNSATAIATQAGEQALKQQFGPVNGIIGGDQFALILQSNGITRMTYVGPPVVFQFDEIEASRGLSGKGGCVKAGRATYFISEDGFYVTDGVSVNPIGAGKIDKTFLTSVGASVPVRACFNEQKKCVFWSYAESGTTIANRLVAFHIPTGNWTRANQLLQAVDRSEASAVFGPEAYDGNNRLSTWASTAGAIGTATITTGDLELNSGGRAFVDGVKPNVESTGTAPAITVRVGSRSDLATTPSYTATTTPTTRTGFADCRVEAKYHRAEVQIVGNFDRTTGIEVRAQITGDA